MASDILTAILKKHINDPADMLKKTRDNMGGAVVSNLRRFLFEYSGGICVVCEQECVLEPGKENSAECGHIIPASAYAYSDNRAGYVPGNVATMCKSCNLAAKDFPFHLHLELIRSDLIPCEWPALYKKAWTPKESHGEKAFAIRKEKGLPF